MGLKLRIHNASNLSLRSHSGVTSKFKSASFVVNVALTDGKGHPLSGGKMRSRMWAGTESVSAKSDMGDESCGTCEWNTGIELSDHGLAPNVAMEIAVRRDFGKLYPSHEIGRTRTTVRELAEMDDDGTGIEFMIFDLGRFDKDGDVVSAGASSLPTIVRVSVIRDSLPTELRSFARAPPLSGLMDEEEEAQEDKEDVRRLYAKRLMIVTRGTRGDIQPFVALARGLAEMKNWEIIIVTELEFLNMLRSQQNVKAGRIRFRPSGGDTIKRVQSQISQKAINLKINAKQTNFMQKIFLARSEVEFFPSEPAVFYWAKKMKPDLLMFGFTMASVTLIASEALGIPVVGFVLQPTSIPSSRYPPVLPLTEERFNMLTVESIAQRHDHFKMLKYAMENVGGKANKMSLSALRERRGLEPYASYKRSTWQELKDKNYPLIVPISETLFGGKPDDWSPNSVFTDCIFLRGDSVPPLADDVQAFVDNAKADGGKIVILAFSSMPVTKSAIVSVALKIINGCQAKACVFALVGAQVDLPLDASVEAQADEAVKDGRLFITSGAPFGRLFPLVDAVVLHGGLGTTSEAIQAKVPAIVTGVLLLDQRFWGSRCAQLDVGPFGTHIDDFPEHCVDYVDRALSDDSVWRKNAERVGSQLTEQAGDDPSGVRRNVECVVRMCEEAAPYFYSRADDPSMFDSTVSGASSMGLQDLQTQSQLCSDPNVFGVDEVYVQNI